MAVKKSVTKRYKKQNSPNTFFKSVLFFRLVFASVLFLVLYSQKDSLAYYLGFKTDKNTDTNARNESLEKVLDAHIEKSFGIDISEYQHSVDWENIKEIEGGFPIEFVFVRATAGSNRVDKKFKKNWSNARQTNFFQGAYHYYRPNENSLEQARNFIKNVTLQKGDFPPVLDIEKLPKNQSIARLKVGLQNWLNAVEKHYGVKPIIYSGESYYNDFLKEEFSEYPFWVANYSAFYTGIDANWSIWQVSESGKVNGIKDRVDVNIYNGTTDDLKKLLIK